MKQFIERLEDAKISFGQWIAGFTGVVVIRFLLETFSSPAAAFPAAPDGATMAHYFLFYLGAFISAALLINIFVPRVEKITKVLLFISPLLWLPPIIDYIHSGGSGYAITYIFAGGNSLMRDFFTFGGSGLFGGMTVGIKTELAIIIFGIGSYVFLKTKSFFKTIIALILSYLLIFFWVTLPSLLALAMIGFGPMMSASVSQVFNVLIAALSASHIPINIIRPVEQGGYLYSIGLIFNAGISYSIYIIDSLLALAWLISYRRSAAVAIFKNVRVGRALHFWFMIAVGAITAMAIGGEFTNWIDGMMVVAILISFLCAWLFAVGINDVVDVDIDAVSNSDRPLIAGALDESVLRSTNTFFLGWSLIGGFILGYWAFFLILVFTAAYYVYSVPPFRLKRVPMLATFLIAIASLSAAMAGFYLFDPGRLIGDFPRQLLFIILIFFTLCTNIKDVKDVEGDRAAGIATIPAIFGEKHGRQVVGLMFSLSFILVGFVLRSPAVVTLSILAAIAGYASVAVGTFREWRSFAVYFAYAVLVLILISLRLG